MGGIPCGVVFLINIQITNLFKVFIYLILLIHSFTITFTFTHSPNTHQPNTPTQDPPRPPKRNLPHQLPSASVWKILRNLRILRNSRIPRNFVNSSIFYSLSYDDEDDDDLFLFPCLFIYLFIFIYSLRSRYAKRR